MIDERIKDAVEGMSVDTSRGRMKKHNREIRLESTFEQEEESSLTRARGYIETARKIGDMVQANRYGLDREELEQIELVREQLYHLAKGIYNGIADRY